MKLDLQADAWSREQVRAYDQIAIAAGVPGPVLMENAARGCVELLLGLGIDGVVHIVAGKGNNGGDGFVMARLLAGLGKRVEVTVLADPASLSGDAAIAYAPLPGLPIPIHPWSDEAALARRLREAAWVVDALLGTGTQGAIRAPWTEAIHAINDAERPVLAIDLPSGMDADTGLPTTPAGPVVRATHTATFVARKLGFTNPAARSWTGRVHVVDIGADAVVAAALRSPEEPPH